MNVSAMGNATFLVPKTHLAAALFSNVQFVSGGRC